MKRQISFIAVLLTCWVTMAAAAGVTVKITQPTTTSVQSPVAVAATGTGTFYKLQLYLDGHKYSDTTTNSIAASLPLSVGSTHTIAVQAIDKQGSVLGKDGPKSITIAPPPLVAVTIAPQTATVASAGTQQFTATVTGTANTAVNWSSSVGTVSPAGLFTAPTITAPETASVKASSVVDPTKSASASVSLTSPQSVTLSNVQNPAVNWKTCGNCGNSGGGGPHEATYAMTNVTTPVVQAGNTAADFAVGGNYGYNNAFWYREDGSPKGPLKSLTYEMYLYVPTASANLPQGIEFQCQMEFGGLIYNFAWQAEYHDKIWRTFDYTNRAWIATSITFSPFTPNAWHHLIAKFHMDGSNAVHDSLTVDGVTSPVNITRPGFPTKAKASRLTNAFQLDLDKNADDYQVYVDQMSVSYQQ